MANQNNSHQEEVLTEEQAAAQYSEQVQIRRQKLADLKARGQDPFEKTSYPVTAHAAQIVQQFELFMSNFIT